MSEIKTITVSNVVYTLHDTVARERLEELSEDLNTQLNELSTYVESVENRIPTKISQLTNDRGFTTNKGTVTGMKVNGQTKLPNDVGIVDIGTVITELPEEADRVVETGTSDIWHYRKWESGYAEVFGTVTTTKTLNRSQGGGYAAVDIAVPDYPFTFTEAPNVQVTASNGGDLVALAYLDTATSPTTNPGMVNLWRGNSSTDASTKSVFIKVCGYYA